MAAGTYLPTLINCYNGLWTKYLISEEIPGNSSGIRRGTILNIQSGCSYSAYRLRDFKTMDCTSCPVPENTAGNHPFCYSNFPVFYLTPNILTVHPRADRIGSYHHDFLKQGSGSHIQTKQEYQFKKN